MRRLFPGSVLALLALWLLAGQQAAAGTADVAAADGGTMRFEYAGDKLRVTTSQADAPYMVVRDGKIYMVQDQDGQTMVIDLGQAMGMFGNLAGSVTPSMMATEVISLEATGAKETHGGVLGDVYTLRYRTGDGKEQQADVVLSDDPRALAFRDAITRFAATMAQSIPQQQQQVSDDIQARLVAMNKGVLRYGKDMTVTAFSDAAVDEARFTLPAAPTDLSGIGRILQQAGQGDGQGTGPSSEVGKALGRIFGQ